MTDHAEQLRRLPVTTVAETGANPEQSGASKGGALLIAAAAGGAPPTAQHRAFQERLKKDGPAKQAWAGYLIRQGHTDVVIPPTYIAPTADEAWAYSDIGDVFSTKDGRRLRWEIKGIGYRFTCRDDWPFNEVFLTGLKQFIRHNGEVEAYISISPDLRYAAVAHRSTRDVWFTLPKWMSNTGNIEEKVCCPTWDVEFIKLVPNGTN